MGKSVKKVFGGGGKDYSKELARQQEQARLKSEQMQRDSQVDLSTRDQLEVYEGAAADNSSASDYFATKKKSKGLSGALGLGGF